MSNVSDIQDLFGSVNSTWAKNRAHFFAHVLMGIVVFVLCKATLPEIGFPNIDAKRLMTNQWYALAKDTGVIYLAIAAPLFVGAVYLATIRIVGNLFTVLVRWLIPTLPWRFESQHLTVEKLEPLAIILGEKDKYYIEDFYRKAFDIIWFRNLKPTDLQDSEAIYLKSYSSNAQIYLGDFFVFLLSWILIFKFAPQLSWVRDNIRIYWPVVFVMAFLICFAQFRVMRAFARMPKLALDYVTKRLAFDPEFFPVPKVSDEDRIKVRAELEKTLSIEAEENRSTWPSLRRFLRYRIRGTDSPDKGSKDERREERRGFPLQKIYARGLRFSYDKTLNENYDDGWICGYLAFVYFRLYRRLSIFFFRTSKMLLWLIIGIP